MPRPAATAFRDPDHSNWLWNEWPRLALWPDAIKAPDLRRLFARRGVLRCDGPSAADACHAATTNRSRGALVFSRLCGEGTARRGVAGWFDGGSVWQTARRQARRVGRCVVPARRRRSRDSRADTRYRRQAGDPAAWQPGRQSKRSSEVTRVFRREHHDQCRPMFASRHPRMATTTVFSRTSEKRMCVPRV